MYKSIFISSSGDLAALRKGLKDDLYGWLDQHGFAHLLKPYLWEEEKEDGRLWSDRQGIQSQVPDPAGPEVPLTICLFGERCGSPLEDELGLLLGRRFDHWRAKGDGPGLLHPWPHNSAEQARALARGQYPLTGTVFELLSAHAKSYDADNLIVACVVDRPVMPETAAESVVLNSRKLYARLTSNCSKAKARDIEAEIYDPQASALLNLLKDHARKVRFVASYPSEELMRRKVFDIAQEKLRRKLGIASLRNPFKQSLAHWTVEDDKLLPGRTDAIRDIVAAMRSHGSLILLKGRSGCGKSSLMQSGVMRRLREIDGSLLIPFRPTELVVSLGRGDELDKLVRLIADTAGVPRPDGGPMAMRPGNYAKRLEAALERERKNLVIGLDQFEEIIDELKLERDRTKTTPQSGWWLVLRFLNALCRSPRVRLIATLESAREKSFDNLRIGEAIGLMPKTFNVDATDDTVAEIAKSGFARGGLPLDPELIEAIKRRWRAFEHETPGSHASPLPLAGLFFHRLYELFADQAGATAAERLESVFKQAGARDDQLLTVEEIGGEEAIAFADIVQNLADEAWRAGGEDPDFVDPVEKDEGFRALNNFLKSFVAVDDDGQMQLRAEVEVDANEGTRRMRRAFRDRRLLVPVPGEGPQRLRLAHQALIDRWSPARRWLALRKQHLQTVQRFLEDADFWQRRGKSMPLEKDGSTLRAAALTLHEHLLDWRLCRSGPLEKDVAALRDQALAIFDTAEDPFAVVVGSANRLTYATLAAYYHCVGLLAKFAANNAACLTAEDAHAQNLLYHAAWSNGPAVLFLIEKRVALKTEKNDISAIATAIWEKLDDNFDVMVNLIDLDDAIQTRLNIRMIHIAAQKGNAHVLNHLLDNGATPDTPDDYGRTALFYAAQEDRPDTFGRLLPLIDVQKEDERKGTAISAAAHWGASNVLSTYMELEADAERLCAMLRHQDEQGNTPLMIAARQRQLEALRVLMQADLGQLGNPADAVHRGKNGDTVFHGAFRGFSGEAPLEADRFAVRAVVEALLQDGRLEPNLQNNKGETPFDLGAAYPEARRALRQDSRVPSNYAAMTPAMRIEDLSSRRPATVLRLLRQAPQALTDEHQKTDIRHAGVSAQTKGETGLEILVLLRNHAVLTALTDDPQFWPKLRESFDGMLKVAGIASAERLRDALLRRFMKRDIDASEAGKLVATCLDADDTQTASALIDHGAIPMFHRDEYGQTALHKAAIAGDLGRFRRTLAIGPFAVPRDDWGRRPSDLAAETLADTLRSLEANMDEPAEPKTSPFLPSASAATPPFLILERHHEAHAANMAHIEILQREWNKDWGSFDNLEIRVFDVPFYPGVPLLELRPRPSSGATGRVCFLIHDDRLYRLNGSSSPIHELNAKTELVIDEETVLSYLNFFCFFVQGDEGPFLVIDRPEHGFLPDLGDQRGNLIKIFRPPKIWGKDDGGCWRVSCLVYYSNAVFIADFSVRPTGMIEMYNDPSVIEDLPACIDSPLEIRSAT